MAQIIKHRRGTLAELSGVTLANGELGVVTSSVSNIGDAVLKTAMVVGHTDGTNRLSVGRIIAGNATPDLSGVTGGSVFNDMLYHETDAKTLLVLNTGGNTNLDLTGNIANREVNGTLDVTGRVDAQSGLDVTGSLNANGQISGLGGLSLENFSVADSTGNTDIDGTLNVNGTVTLDGNSQALTHSGTGNLTISSTSGDVLVEGSTFSGNNVTVPGTLDVTSNISVQSHISASGNVTASDIYASGNIHAVGNITFEAGTSGTIQLGDASGDNLVIGADISSSLLPNDDDSFDLGSSGQQWKDLYIDGTANIDTLSADTAAIGDLTDNRVVIAGTSGELEDDANFTFDGSDLDVGGGYGSTGTTISTAGVFQTDGATTLGSTIDVSGIADFQSRVDAQAGLDVTGSVNISSTTNIDGNLDVDNTTTTIDSSNAISLDAGAASNFSTSAGALTLDGAGGVNIEGNGSEIDITTAGATLDVNAGIIDIDATGGAVNIDSDTGINIGTTADKPIDIDSTTLDIDASGALTIDSATSVSIGTTADVAFDIDTSTLDIDSSGAVTIDGATGSHFKSAGTLALSGSAVTIAGGGGSEIDITTTGGKVDINAGDLDVDTTGAISLDSSAGSIDINVVDGQTVKVGLNGAVETIWTPHGTAGSEKWSTTNTAGTATDAIAVTATAGGIDIGAGTVLALDGAGGIDIGKAADVAIDVDASTFDLDASSTIHLSGSSVTLDGSGVSIEGNASEVDITTTGTVDINSAAFDVDASGAVTVDSSASTIAIGGNAVAQKITVGGDTGTRTEVELNAILVDINGGASGVTIDSTSGISLDAGAASNLSTSDGAITISGNNGLNLQEGGSDVIAISDTRDILFGQTGGTTSDPDFEVDGYARFDGTTEFETIDVDGTSDFAQAAVFNDRVDVGGALAVTGSMYILGNFEVGGATTYITSSNLLIGDNIIELNTAGAAADAGIYVYDVTGNQTGSILWDRTNNYWKGGLKDSEYRLPEQVSTSDLTANRLVYADASGRISSSNNISDMETYIDVNDVDLTSINKLEGVDTVTYIDLGNSDSIETTGNLYPTTNNVDDLGKTAQRFKDLWLQGNADLEGDIDVNGTANLDIVDIDGAVDMASTLQLDGTLTVSADDIGSDVRVYSATTNEGLHYDASEDELGLLLTTKLKFHDIGGGEEIYASADGHLEINAGTTLDITAPTVDINAATELNIDGDVDLNGTLDVSGVADFQSRVDAQASLAVTGSVYVSAGASVAAASASLVSFRNDSSTQLGYLASADTQAVTTGLVGYNMSTGNLTISSVIDGGTF